MVSDWSRRIALMASGIHFYPEAEPKEEAATPEYPVGSFKRRRKRNQQDRFHTKLEANRHPSLNKD